MGGEFRNKHEYAVAQLELLARIAQEVPGLQQDQETVQDSLLRWQGVVDGLQKQRASILNGHDKHIQERRLAEIKKQTSSAGKIIRTLLAQLLRQQSTIDLSAKLLEDYPSLQELVKDSEAEADEIVQ